MKHTLLFFLVLSSFANARTTRAPLATESTDSEKVTRYRCILPSTTTEVGALLDLEKKTLTVDIAGAAALSRDERYRFVGPYVDVDWTDKYEQTTKIYTLNTHAYNIALSFPLKGKPRLTLAWGANEFLCQ